MKNLFLFFLIVTIASCKQQSQSNQELKSLHTLVEISGKTLFTGDMSRVTNVDNAKLYALKLTINNSTKDSINVMGERGGNIFQDKIHDVQHGWINHNQDLYERGKTMSLNPNSSIQLELTTLWLNSFDSLKFRYYFKTTQFKDSLMWHDVSYRLKDDSFIILKQSENEMKQDFGLYYNF